ncbi:NAD-dependent epimerase/dehydratase family protein [Novosphingobium sp. FSY-8]|uniref:NAD-dependent epimerase/dehydratase family protein n=1 Tax=Novosphingobium ovatum TaxID=1908523 RepID=A0ABW9XHZ0_9SPHN|nr:NAD-dependent epimerase/dehydratase family protein [Novosphingobium ovatum]NBC38178.1 NAD-dependent epimerase/dehydratase family protein [Novosphingobium ovatum]
MVEFPPFAPAIAQALADEDRRIVITGAGGWLGLATLDLLAGALGADAVEKRVRCFGASDRVLRLCDGTPILQRPLADLAWLPNEPTLVLHTAFLTKDRAEAMNEGEYRAANAAISQTVLRALTPIGADAVFVASSGAAAKADDPAASPAMRLYGAMKRDDEALFAQWAQDTGKAAVIARLYALAGPRINKPGAYALASFALDALAGRPIAVRAPRAVVRAYAPIREVMSLVFALMLRGGGVTRFDSGGTPMELADVAAIIADLVPGGRVDRAPITDPASDIYHGDGDAYAALLAAHGIAPVPLADAFAETMNSLAGYQP